MLDLFPPGTIAVLKAGLGDRFDMLSETSRLALAITLTEGRLTHSRLTELCQAHAADVSKTLRELVKDRFLTLSGNGRGTVYRLLGVDVVTPEDVFGELGGETPNLTFRTPNLTSGTPNLNPETPNLASGTPNLTSARDPEGRLVSPHHALPFIDHLGFLSPEFYRHLLEIAAEPREKAKISHDAMKAVILALCKNQYVTLRILAELVARKLETLRSQYLTSMSRGRELQLAFPDSPNHVQQAYRSTMRVLGR